MFTRFNIAISLFLIVIIITGCNKSKSDHGQEYYHVKPKIWENYLQAIGVKEPNLNNLILLVARPTDCPSCLKELNWWNTKGRELIHHRIIAVVVTKYAATFHAFVNENIDNITAFRDSSTLILQESLVPTLPIKIYFNGQSKPVLINKIGTDGKLFTFAKKVQRD